MRALAHEGNPMQHDDFEMDRSYREMAADIERETEALEWIEDSAIDGWDPVLDEPLRRALDDWSWLFIKGGKEIIDATPFGDLILRDPVAELYWLNVNAGRIARFLGTEEERTRIFDSRTAKELERQGLTIERNQCYALKPQAIFKAYTLENTYVATLSQYVSFMGDFHRQIKDLPDGTTVRAKVK
jgi:hypothetical protein